MAEPPIERTSLLIPWKTLFKIVAVVGLVWLWFELYQIVLVVVVAILLSVALNPAVKWLERHGWRRWVASAAVSFTLLALVVAFLWLTWSSLVVQAGEVTANLNDVERELMRNLPRWMRDSIRPPTNGDVTSYLGPYALVIAQSTTSALTYGLLGVILMIYLLMEAQDTRDWLLAFVSKEKRAKAERTLDECERVIFAYAAGNALTSLVAFTVTLLALWWLKVPAALLLALMAGLSDFVPVIGFIVSSIPAVLLALTVSGWTAFLVVVVYIAYNTIEAYVLTPWVYGNRLKLSNVAIILGFAVGAEVAGVIGALIALPVAAIYPTIERIWLREQVGEETVREHREIARKAG